MDKKLLGLSVLFFGLVVAQGTAILTIEGKKATLPWITVKNKVYIPLESLQKAGVVVKKTGNTYQLNFPKPQQSSPPVVAVVPAPTPAVPVTSQAPRALILTTPVSSQSTPATMPEPIFNSEPPQRSVGINGVLKNLLGSLGTPDQPITPPSAAPEMPAPPSAPATPPSTAPEPVASPTINKSTSLTNAPVPPTSPATPAPVALPSAPASPANLQAGTVITVSSVNANSTSKPQLEGCANQMLNNGVWSAKLVAVTQITFRERPGYAFVLEMMNLSKDTISLFDAGFSDGEGGLGNFIVVTADNRSFVTRDANPEFIYQNVTGGQKLIFTLRFTFDSIPAAPIRLLITQERRVPGFAMPDPSLRFRLDCK
jgi:hypothetical protein